MITTRIAIVISLGVFLGFLSYGVQTTVVNYNTLVNPKRHLQIMSIERESEEMSFMGEEVELSQPNVDAIKEQMVVKLAGIKELAGDICEQLIEEYNELKKQS